MAGILYPHGVVPACTCMHFTVLSLIIIHEVNRKLIEGVSSYME